MIGQTLGNYRIEALLGAGGMGVVYRAYDTKLQRRVAIKVVSGAADEASRARLLHEARAASALNHPHICTIHEVEETADQAFIVMEYVEGQTLTDIIPRAGLPAETVICYGAQIADAFAHAHDRGVVHRDLKSANVMITPDGRAKVLDFGLAKRLAADDIEEVTRSGRPLAEEGGVAGTLGYMAPEVLRGQPVDARSDIWALGVLLFEMMAGDRPFKAQTGAELIAAILQQPAAPIPPRAPAGLGTVIRRCLTKELRQRYQRAGEVRAVLEAMTSEVTAAGPVSRPRARRLAHHPSRIRSLAVLPLENLARDPEQDYFVDGMTEALITGLAKIGALKVISRTSVMRYKGSDKPLPEIARELNVDAILEGSVLRAAGQVRITAQLIHAASDTHLWAESYDRELTNILSVQSDVARAIAHEIKIKLTPREQAQLAGKRTVNPAAHEAYLKGRYFWNQRGPGLKKSIEFFQRALAEDPTYASAYAGLADAYALLGFYGYFPPTEVMPKAKEAARKALELDPNLAEAHASLGFVHTIFDWDWAMAEKEFQRVFKLNPSWSPARYWHTNLLMLRGRFEEAIAELRRGLEYDPLSVYMQSHLGTTLWYGRRSAEASEQFRKALELDPNFLVARSSLGMTYYFGSRLEDSLRELERAVESSGRNQWPLAWLGVVYAGSGDWQRAREIITELEQRRQKEYISALHIAEIYGQLDEKDKAFEWLEKAYEERSSLLWSLEWLPSLPEKLRRDPRFEDLLRRIGVRDGE